MLYYIDDSHPTKVLLAERGFSADLCKLAGLPGAQLLTGPDGKSGSLFRLSDEGLASPAPYTPIRYDSAGQRWFYRGAGIWFGWSERPPAPGVLRRKTTLSGHMVRLRDGNDWEVPAIRIITGETGLPRVFCLDNDGQVTRVVPIEYAALQGFVERAWTVISGGPDSDLMDNEAFEFACAALRLNYRIERSEVAAMELISDRNELIPCLRAMCDGPTLQAYMEQLNAETAQKKTALAEVPSL